MTKLQKHNLAIEIINLLANNGMFYETCLYLNNKRYSSEKNSSVAGIKSEFVGNSKYYIEDNINIKDYIEYADNCVIAMTSESDFFITFMNDYPDSEITTEFNKILDKYGLYYEQDNSWTFTLYNK